MRPMSVQSSTPSTEPTTLPSAVPVGIPSPAVPVVVPSPVVPVVVPSPVTITPTNSSETMAPAQMLVCDPPITMAKREELLLAIVNDITAESIILTMGTSQNTAFAWLVDEDEAKLCPNRVDDIKQRYIMAVNYYSQGGDDWFVCNALSSSNVELCVNEQRHLSKANVCDWFNVTCSTDGNITDIVLGELPVLLF
jgi:hypothetical protein